jgi:hypothetical protein
MDIYQAGFGAGFEKDLKSAIAIRIREKAMRTAPIKRWIPAV